MIRRSVVVNEVEPGPLSLRAAQGTDFTFDLAVFAANGDALDLTTVAPTLQLEPRSGGALQSYQGQLGGKALGVAAFAIPGDQYKDANGYRLSLFGTLDGWPQLLARGVAISYPGPSQPSSGSLAPSVRGVYDLNIVRNDSWTWQFVLWGDAAKSIKSDLTGATITAQIRATFGGPVLVNLACAVQGDPVDGVVWMSISSVQSGSLPALAYWDMQIAYPGGEVRTPIGGQVFVTEDVTEP